MPQYKTQKKNKRLNNYYNFPNEYQKEGVDHINIGIQSTMAIGKIFDPGYVKNINYPYIGKFSSVSSLWYWIRSEKLDDNYRKLVGPSIKKYSNGKSVRDKFVPNFKAIIGYATWLKIKQYPNIIEQISKLDDSKKLLSYHVIKTSNVRVCTSYAGFIIDIAEVIIKAVKEGVEPNFDCFVTDDKMKDLYYLEGFLSLIRSNAEILEMKKQDKQAQETQEI